MSDSFSRRDWIRPVGVAGVGAMTPVERSYFRAGASAFP